MSEEVFIDDGNSYVPHLFKIFEKYSTISLNMGIYKKNHQPSAGTSLSRFFRDLGGANLCSSYFF